MRQFLITVFGVLTALVIAFIAIPVTIAILLTPSEPAMPQKMVLTLDLGAAMVEEPASGLLALSPEGAPLALAELHGGLKAAAADDAVAGLFIRGGDGFVSSARADEIRQALAPFKAAGKPVVAFAQDVSPVALGDYMVLADADTLWLQPTGSFLPAGMALQQMFLKGALDKLGIEPDFVALHEYKNAPDTFTRSDMSQAQLDQYSRYLETVYTHVTGAIAEARGVPAADLQGFIAQTPFSADKAMALGLVDALGYESAVREQVLEEAGETAEFVSLARYARNADAFGTGEAVIAVIYGQGPILPGESEPVSPFSNGPTIGADTLSRAIGNAVEDEDVQAIVLRIDSPGGSASASDQVWKAIQTARAAGKPVVASMGDVAASGGYYIPVASDLIVAQPTTLTGSIGIFGGKFAVSGLLEKMGVSVDGIVTSENATLWSAEKTFTDDQRERFTAWLEDGYKAFKEKVAMGRGLTMAETEGVARGRIWAGADAKDQHLVDRLGGFGDAVAAAAELADIDPAADVELRTFPKPRSLEEEIFAFTASAPAAARALSLMTAFGIAADADPRLAALVDAARRAQAGGGAARYETPPVWLE